MLRNIQNKNNVGYIISTISIQKQTLFINFIVILINTEQYITLALRNAVLCEYCVFVPSLMVQKIKR